MMVQFDSDSGHLVMRDEHAVRLIRMCGHSGTVPGAIPSEDVAAALARLEAALAAEPDPDPAPRDDDDEPPVPLRTRAHPLLVLLREAAADESGVQWREG